MSVNFVLTELESSVQMGTAATILQTELATLDVSAVAVFEVSVDDMKACFKYQTDSNDLVNAEDSDIKYYVHPDSWPDLNPANAMMDATDSSGAIATANGTGDLEPNKMLVAHDFVRYLALKLFNTHFGVDLFNNELELLQNLRLICSDTAEGNTLFDIKASIEKVGVSGDHSDIKGADGEKYMDNSNSSSENLCRILFEQMTKMAITRFAEIADSDEKQSLPFLADDTISFKVVIAAAEGQEELTGVNPIDPRSYEILLKLVDGPTTNTDVAEEEL